jgi:hypothetical protein
LGTPLTVDPSWLQRQEGALRALQVAAGTVGQREQGLRSEGAVVDKKQVLAMMMHIFRGGQLLQNQLFTGHWRYDGYVCHFSVYDTTRVYQRAYQQLGLGPTTSIQEAFRQAASKVPELNLVPKNSLAPATLSADKIVISTPKSSTQQRTRDGLPSWIPRIGTVEGDAAFLALTRGDRSMDTHRKRDGILRASQDPELRKELEESGPQDRAKLFDAPDAPLILGFDPGFTFLLRCEAIAHDVTGNQVRRCWKLACSSMQSITDRFNRGDSQLKSHLLALALEASSQQGRHLMSLLRTSLVTCKRAWKRATDFKAAQQKVVSELLELSGISAFGKTGRTMTGSELEFYTDELKYSHLSSIAVRPIAIFIGDGSTHPGKKAGVHGAASGLPILRLFLEELENRHLSHYAFRVDEYLTSQVCPDPSCVNQDGFRNR